MRKPTGGAEWHLQLYLLLAMNCLVATEPPYRLLLPTPNQYWQSSEMGKNLLEALECKQTLDRS
jgi:hypothetical protein